MRLFTDTVVRGGGANLLIVWGVERARIALGEGSVMPVYNVTAPEP